MTLEEKAKQKAEEIEKEQTLGVYDNEEDLVRDSAFNDGFVEGYEEGYIAGAKENGVVWHKTYQELPNDKALCLVCFGNDDYNVLIFNKEDNCWNETYKTSITFDLMEVIAWYEIPQFKEVAE